MTTIGFVTCEKLPEMNPREKAVIGQLESAGYRVTPYIWSRPEHEKRHYDAIVVRSPWDYYERLPEFLQWLDRLPEKNVYNPKALLRWNLDKLYLRELETKGIEIVPTRWVSGICPNELREVIDATDWEDLVIKPVRSAGAYKTARIRKGAIPDLAPYREHSMMVQPMMEGVLTEGEWSVIYLGGEYSHTVLKKPRTGDFRVQPAFGGEETWVETPPTDLRECADRVIATLPEELLYARVDLIRHEGRCFLMEFEVFEPDLFLHTHPAAARRFTEVLAAQVKLPGRKTPEQTLRG